MKLKMKAKIASIHNKISITDEEGGLVSQVHSKVFSLHNVTYLTDGEGEEIAVITRKPVSMHDVHTIQLVDGTEIELRTELLHLTRDVLDIEALGWQLTGNLLQHDYQLKDDQGQLLAQTHRKWLSLHDTYEVDVVDEERMDLIVAVLVALDKIMADRQLVANASDDAARISKQN